MPAGSWKHGTQAEANGRGSLDLDGKMVDVPVVKRAQNLSGYGR